MTNGNKKKIWVSDIIGDDYKKWKDEFVVLDCGTGCGKTFFCINRLGKYARSKNRKILYLCNRTNLRNQIYDDVKKKNLIGTMYVTSYQSLQKKLVNGKRIAQYDYIICDECHYFTTDATFNNYTDISYNYVMSQTKAVEKYGISCNRYVEDGRALQKIIDKYKDAGLYTDDDGSGKVYIHFKGDVSEAEKTLNDFMTDVRALSEETGDGYGFLGNIEQYAAEELGIVQDTIEEYRDIYNTALQSDMISKGFGEDAPATVYKDYADAIEKYNEALSSGDTESISEAKSAFDEVKGSVDDI